MKNCIGNWEGWRLSRLTVICLIEHVTISWWFGGSCVYSKIISTTVYIAFSNKTAITSILSINCESVVARWLASIAILNTAFRQLLRLVLWVLFKLLGIDSTVTLELFSKPFSKIKQFWTALLSWFPINSRIFLKKFFYCVDHHIFILWCHCCYVLFLPLQIQSH